MQNSEKIEYSLGSLTFNGYASYDNDWKEKRPAVLVAPTWMGLNRFAQAQAEALVELGYVGFAVDLFGMGKTASDQIEAKKLITPLIEDRRQIRDRMKAAFDRIRQHHLVDPHKIAAIGFCFGGSCVLEFARGGYPLLGAVSFHAVFGNPYKLKMKPLPPAEQIKSSVLVLHGYKDPMAQEEDLLLFQREMSERGVDWQVIVYGEAMHAFTNPNANLPEIGLQYDEKTAKRAWLAMSLFLSEIFKT
ncbi:MAG: dienelactone hydrolase family protein [Chlamydiales bacterium]